MKNKLYKNKKWLKQKYCKEELSIIEISELCGVRRQTIYVWIYLFDLTRKKVFPRRSKSRYSLNERYFENIDNGTKAYWLGFIAADGCLTNTKGQRILFIELSRKDRNHLEKFKKEVGYGGPIYDLKRKSNNILSSKIQICSCLMVQDLVKHGIIPNKTNFLKKPDIDKKYYHHWIRGIFDGDGSVSLSKDGTLRGEFFGTEKVLNFIVSYIPGTDKVSKKNKSKGYYHSFGGNKLANKMYDYLYKNSEICLERKRNKFLLKVKDKSS